MAGDRANYERSNAIRVVTCDVTDAARDLARRILLESSETGHRQILAEAFADTLCDGAAIDVVRRITISDARQYHRTHAGRVVFRQYGYYHPARQYLYITNRTAARGQLLSGGAFLTTLLHEWMHHYDHVKLGLQSIHTSGFYARLRWMRERIEA